MYNFGMELFKSKENHKDPVKTARSNYFALGFFYVLLGVLFFGTKQNTAILFVLVGIFLFYAGYLLSKRNILGIYLGWLFVIVGFVSAIFNGVLISLIVVAYLAYWNYKAGEVLKKSSTV